MEYIGVLERMEDSPLFYHKLQLVYAYYLILKTLDVLHVLRQQASPTSTGRLPSENNLIACVVLVLDIIANFASWPFCPSISSLFRLTMASISRKDNVHVGLFL